MAATVKNGDLVGVVVEHATTTNVETGINSKSTLLPVLSQTSDLTMSTFEDASFSQAAFYHLSASGNVCFSVAGFRQLITVVSSLHSKEQRRSKPRLDHSGDGGDEPDNERPDDSTLVRNDKNRGPLDIKFALFSQSDQNFSASSIFRNEYNGEVITLHSRRTDQINDWLKMATAIEDDDWLKMATAFEDVGVAITSEENEIVDYTDRRPLPKTILFNVINFKARWSGNLHWDILTYLFTDDMYRSIYMKFIYTRHVLEYAKDAERQIQILKLELDNRDYNLLILLPPKKKIGQLEKSLISKDYLSGLKLKPTLVSACIPMFSFEMKIDSDNLNALANKIDGDPQLFSDPADLYVQQLYTVKIGAKFRGIKLENFSRMSSTTLPAVRFVANRPFVYLLCDRNSVLLAGRFSDPM